MLAEVSFPRIGTVAVRIDELAILYDSGDVIIAGAFNHSSITIIGLYDIENSIDKIIIITTLKNSILEFIFPCIILKHRHAMIIQSPAQ